MKIIVKVKPASREDKIEKINENSFAVSVKAPPVDGKANAALVKLLAEYFDISPSLVEIISGHLARVKVIRIHS
jgi:uncharacterized protein (TIGR00251 family)